MNNLIISIAKERILPLTHNFIDYPNEQFESQMHKLSTYMTKSILDAYVVIDSWSFAITEQSKLTLALKTVFPNDWLSIAEKSPSYHLQLQKMIHSYSINLSEESIQRIHKVVEFLCYEIIENTVIYSNFRKVSELGSEHIQNGIDGDAVLKKIVNQNNIHVTTKIQLNHNELVFTGINVSNKAHRLMRLYIEEMVHTILDGRQHYDTLTLHDVERYFK
jgi:hypothetical protein